MRYHDLPMVNPTDHGRALLAIFLFSSSSFRAYHDFVVVSTTFYGCPITSFITCTKMANEESSHCMGVFLGQAHEWGEIEPLLNYKDQWEVHNGLKHDKGSVPTGWWGRHHREDDVGLTNIHTQSLMKIVKIRIEKHKEEGFQGMPLVTSTSRHCNLMAISS